MFHDRLARHTIGRAHRFCQANGVELIIRLDGGTPEDGTKWLVNHTFKPQGEGDLGERLRCAVQDAFDHGSQRVVVIGTDCPELDQQTLSAAFAILLEYPVVFGPAFDGGYYLVGLTQPSPALFENIDWGGSQVFAQSLAAAQSAGLAVGQLGFLSDVDVPEDLAAAEIALNADSSPHS